MTPSAIRPARKLASPGVADPLPPAPKASCFLPFPWAHFGNAWWLLDQHMYAAGVLIAQTAVEMGAGFAFIHLLHRRYGPLDDGMVRDLGPPDYSFMEKDTRRLWTDLTGGDSVTEPKATWKAYVSHVEFRNRIAHGSMWGDSNGGRDACAAALTVSPPTDSCSA